MMQKLKLSGNRIRQAVPVVMAVLMIGFISYLGAHLYNLSQAAAPGTIYVTSASTTVAPDATLSITVREESGTSPINSVQFFLNYNAAQLQYLSKTESGEFNFEGPTSTADPGVIRVQRGMQGSELTGDHAIVTLHFKVLAASGSTAVTIDKANSLLVSGGQDILQTTTGQTYTVAVAKDAVFSMTPTSGAYAKDATVSVVVRLNSPTQRVFSAQPIILYPADKLAYVSTTSSAAFPSATRTVNTAGTLDLIRGISPGGAGFIGNDVVATVNFKVIGTSGSIPLSFKNTSGVYDADGQNILGSSTGSTYSVQTASAPVPPPTNTPPSNNAPVTATPPTVTDSAPNTTSSLYRSKVTYTPTGNGTVTAVGESTQIQGNVELAPVTNAELLARNPSDTITKVEYYLGKKLIATKTAPPFTYKLETEKYKNGTYDMTIKTYYKSGAIDSSKNKVSVKNPVDLAYIMVHYGTVIIGSVLALAVIGFIAFKYLRPRFLRTAPLSATDGYDDGYDGYAGTIPPDAGHAAPDPSIITPTDGPADTAVLTAEQTAAAQSTEAIPMPPGQTVTPTQTGQDYGPATPSGQTASAPEPESQPEQSQRPPQTPYNQPPGSVS